MSSKNIPTNAEAAKLLESSMKESYLSSLEMIQAFSFGDWNQAKSALKAPQEMDSGMVIGALLGHTRHIFDYVSEYTGMESKDVMRGYGYYFYSNVLTDLEEMFSEAKDVMVEIETLEEGMKDEE